MLDINTPNSDHADQLEVATIKFMMDHLVTLNMVPKIDDYARKLMEIRIFFALDDIPPKLFECHDGNAKLVVLSHSSILFFPGRLFTFKLIRRYRMYNGRTKDFPHLQLCLEDIFPDEESIDESVSPFLYGSSFTKSLDGNRLSYQRIVKELVLRSVKPLALAIRFDWVVFAMNGSFPKSGGGSHLVDVWEECAPFYPHVKELVKVYVRFSTLFRPPILLCEVIRRCAWYLKEIGHFEEAISIVQSAYNILENAQNNNNHQGYFPQYICRLIADMYNTRSSIEYEMNEPDHGRLWFEKADSQRQELIEKDVFQAFDVEDMAIVDGNIALSHLADGNTQLSIACFQRLINTFNSNNSKALWAANLSIAYRVSGKLEKSMAWCERASAWASGVYEAESLSIAIGDMQRARTISKQCSNREYFSSAAETPRKCKLHDGATARSEHMLALTLRELNELDEADRRQEAAVGLLRGLDVVVARP
ncbi:hypothetical protein BX600DRAFT_525704 [Xylariales sp. PMI_506]|nr:hypothetical protein BX600DRAFT_525704 [Xylariales sp. PMI_506]